MFVGHDWMATLRTFATKRLNPKQDDKAGEAWLHGCFSHMLYRRSSRAGRIDFRLVSSPEPSRLFNIGAAARAWHRNVVARRFRNTRPGAIVGAVAYCAGSSVARLLKGMARAQTFRRTRALPSNPS